MNFHTLFYIFLTLVLFACYNGNKIEPEHEEFTPITCNISQLWDYVQTSSSMPIYVADGITVSGIITSSDSAQNHYKELYVEQLSCPLRIKIGMYDTYKFLPVGRAVNINLQHLRLDTLDGILTLGPIDTWNIVNKHLNLQSYSDHHEPQSVHIDSISPQMIGCNVRINNIEFIESAATMSGERTIVQYNDQGFKSKKLKVYSSPYCNFADSLIPSGACQSIEGIIKKHKQSIQLVLNKYSDIYP